MDDQRFDDFTRGLVVDTSRRTLLQWLARGLAGSLLGVAGVRRTRAQDATTSTTPDGISADGGTAVADASAGSGNTGRIAGTVVRDVSGEAPSVENPPPGPESVPPTNPPPTDPLPTNPSNCVPQDEACTRGGMACCPGSECIAGDDARGICLALCGPETTRCNEMCVGFCALNVPHAGGCADCVCRSGQLTCTLSTDYLLPDVCCPLDQECCRVGPLDVETTVQVCCPLGTCNPGVGCV
jgi:hypothetical protein